jgi:hypothetical protein
MSDAKDDYVTLTRSQNFVQQAAIRSVLTDAGIPFLELDDMGPTSWMGSMNTPMGYVEFRCPAACLHEAKDLLCANGIVCDVSERLLRRTLDEVVKPLLAAPSGDPDRLLYLAGINNKETVAAIYEETLKLEGGPGLLQDLFFAMARSGEGNLLLLAKNISDSVSEEFGRRFLEEMPTVEKDVRMALLDVVAAFGKSPWVFRAIAAGLRGEDPEVRDAASEAMFSIEETDHGYDPQDPAEEREAAVRSFLKARDLA